MKKKIMYYCTIFCLIFSMTCASAFASSSEEVMPFGIVSEVVTSELNINVPGYNSFAAPIAGKTVTLRIQYRVYYDAATGKISQIVNPSTINLGPDYSSLDGRLRVVSADLDSVSSTISADKYKVTFTVSGTYLVIYTDIPPATGQYQRTLPYSITQTVYPETH